MNQRNNRKYIVKKGIANIAGGVPIISSKVRLDDHISKELVELTKQFLNDIDNLKEAIENFPLSIDNFIEDWNSILKLELYRGEILDIKNKDKRKNQFMRDNYEQFLEQKIISYCKKRNIEPKFITGVKSTGQITHLIESLPSVFCFLTLLYYRDQQLERPINENDNYDIWSIAQAIPYCDVIQADNLFANIAIQQKLGEKCNSIIIKSIQELPSLL